MPTLSLACLLPTLTLADQASRPPGTTTAYRSRASKGLDSIKEFCADMKDAKNILGPDGAVAWGGTDDAAKWVLFKPYSLEKRAEGADRQQDIGARSLIRGVAWARKIASGLTEPYSLCWRRSRRRSSWAGRWITLHTGDTEDFKPSSDK
ncbi:hypothetical protein B0J12DRAFT_701281 [Macrophomina phaseolina]|uniref:Uncharacterized protein n=1 Tax=Macrophomina phaseolina TaxID=35725 RepID=A0ABQ8G806_9PEZI|nr:hypothetical protein B0J12DRAFT_701281 [Macrophomina phaseolina]